LIGILLHDLIGNPTPAPHATRGPAESTFFSVVRAMNRIVFAMLQTSIVVWRDANTPSMFLRNRRTCLGIGIEPMKNDRFNHPLRIREVLCAVIFKRLEKFGVEAISSLDGLRLVGR